MKKIILSLTLLLFMVKLFSQTPALSKGYYLKKSKNQKTVGWVMLSVGLVTTTIGIIRASSSDYLGFHIPGESPAVAIVGGCLTLASIPFFVTAEKNASKAATISFKNQKILHLLQNTFVLKTQPSLTLKIEL